MVVYESAAMRTRPFLLAFLLLGCVEKEPEKVDEGFIQQNTLSTAPTPRYAVNADLGGKVIYLGCDVDREEIVRGQNVKFTHYWKVVSAPGNDYRVFTHLEGTGKDWLNIDQTKLRSMYGADRWKAGDILRDEQTIPVPKTWRSPTATLYVGLYRKGVQGEGARMSVASGPSDGKNRVKAVTLPVVETAGPKSAPRPDYVIRRAAGKITVDGKGDEPAWQQAPSTDAFIGAQGGAVVPGEAKARFLWDDQNLYVLIGVTDSDVASSYTKHDEPIWKEDAVELFVDADKSGAGYVELQVSPRNVTFDSWFQGGRTAGGDEKWDSGMVTAVSLDGTLDNRDDVDKGWTAEIAIPLAAVKGRDEAMAVTIPPRPGDTWRLNVVRVDKPKDKGVTASAWAEISIQDFHAIDRLRLVAFGDDKGEIPAPAPDAGPPTTTTPPPPDAAPAKAETKKKKTK